MQWKDISEKIKDEYEFGKVSIGDLAKKYHVNKARVHYALHKKQSLPKPAPIYIDKETLAEERRIKREKIHLLSKIRRKLRDRARNAIRGMYKVDSSFALIGCTPEEFRVHMEGKFVQGMSWLNHGEWEIDHIIPLAQGGCFEEIKKLLHYSNTQPLWKKDNRCKGKKLLTPMVSSA